MRHALYAFVMYFILVDCNQPYDLWGMLQVHKYSTELLEMRTKEPDCKIYLISFCEDF